MHEPLFAFCGDIVNGAKRFFAFSVFRARIHELTRSTVKGPSVPISFNKILLQLWANLQGSKSSVPDHRVVTQYRLLFLKPVIRCYRYQPKYSPRASKDFYI